MKAGKPLERRVPLKATKPLQAKQSLSRGRGIERVAKQQPCTDPKPAKARKPVRRDTGPSKRIRNVVKLRSAQGGDHPLCELCGRAGNGNVHHRKPRGMGGSKDPAINLPSNLLWLCGSATTRCHRLVESQRVESLRLGRLVPFEGVSLTTAVLLRYGWVMLDDVGGILPSLPGVA